ncbi:hypothetical protein KUCAC02_021326 [Chaenocephalus aceratus]|uniref:Uncharacterized protein n=1 Tax=Chaenocephalus aceratus TaxID=36190 RepID=A0ACB9XF28_CHAAC|nr:hypothetical protein KUCAC02_021326 [Chaenocephalus aceratus]
MFLQLSYHNLTLSKLIIVFHRQCSVFNTRGQHCLRFVMLCSV